MTFAVFVLSTGRCGTQWLTKNFNEIYRDEYWATHEPIKENYAPRLTFGGRSPEDLPDPYKSIIADHLRSVEHAISPLAKDAKPYIEFGWPCFGAIPYLMDRFDGRVRIVHLVRHPVSCAFSLASHQFIWEQHTKISEIAALTPMDAGVKFPELAAGWSEMSQYERCLYFWAEINARGLALAETAEVPWLTLRFEDLMSGDGLGTLTSFLDIPLRAELLEARSVRQDRVSYPVNIDTNPDVINKYEAIKTIAEDLGYDQLTISSDDLAAYYSSSRVRK